MGELLPLGQDSKTCCCSPLSSPQQQNGSFGQRMKGVRRPDVEPCNLGTERLVQSCSAGWEQNN